MGIRETVRSWLVNILDLNDLSDIATRNRIERLAELRSYYDGLHKEQLRVKPNKFDDNLTINLVGLIVDKSVSALVGDPADGRGLTWTFPSEDGLDEDANGVTVKPPQIDWLDKQWEANKQEILLHKNALVGAESGIPCIKLIPDGAGNIKLRNVNPLLLTVNVDEQDCELVTGYQIRYIVMENDKQVVYREDTLPANPEGTSWTIETKKQAGGKKWEPVGPAVLWAYPFPPILHWQNLPATDTPYGRSDIEGIIGIQDRYNFLISNLSKIIRLYAHPQRYGKNISAQMDNGEFKLGPDEMPLLNGDGDIIQMPPVGDLPGAMQFLQSLRESAFGLSREVDILSLKDKVGAITNFALRVLYHDSLDKLGTKRMLYGQAYQELNRRMLALGNFEQETCIINWPDPLPVNEQEETTALQADMNMGLVSIQTAQEQRGYDHEQEQKRMDAEKQASTNAGGLILSNFFKNGGQQKQPAESVNNPDLVKG
jgi:hypothetical protein